MASNTPQFAEGENVEQLTSDTLSLKQKGWMLDSEGTGISKTFHFKTYFKAVTFLNLVASESSAKKHHSTMTLTIGTVDVHWTTHKPRGLSHRDIAMARYCDDGSVTVGAVEAGQGLSCGTRPPSKA